MSKTMIIAELSGNHNNDLQYTKDTIYEIKKSGADAVKLQTYTADSLTLNVNARVAALRKFLPIRIQQRHEVVARRRRILLVQYFVL